MEEKELVRQCYEEVLNRLGCGVALIKSDLEILHHNARMAHMLAVGDGIRLCGSRLWLSAPKDRARLCAILAGAQKPYPADLTAEVFMVRRPSGDGSYMVSFFPAYRALRHAARRPIGFLTVQEPETVAPVQAALLAECYGLTPTECLIAAAIADGKAPAAIVASMQRSLHTIRDHLASIFMKTYTGSQRDLAILVNRFRGMF